MTVTIDEEMNETPQVNGFHSSAWQPRYEKGEDDAVAPAQANENGDERPVDSQVVAPSAVEKEKEPLHKKAWRLWCRLYGAHSFLILIVAAILLAYAYPPLGAKYLQPNITAQWFAVVFIFVLSGLGLNTSEFSKAFRRVKINVFVQVFDFGVVSAVVFGFTRFMEYIGALASSLADGMVICSCLSVSVNTVIVLSKSSGGDEASAIFNTAFGNMLGVFLTPVLIVGYLGVRGDVALGDVFLSLALRVLLPIIVGQLLQRFSKTVVRFVAKYKKHFKRGQEYCLVYIVYTVFCKTFLKGSDATLGDAFLMVAYQGILLCFLMTSAWYALKFTFPTKPRLRVMGLFACTHKTITIGIPLINAIYEKDPLVGTYTLPLLVWYPMQVLIGSALAPKLLAFVELEEKRLGNEAASVDSNAGEETFTAAGDEETEMSDRPTESNA